MSTYGYRRRYLGILNIGQFHRHQW